MKNTVKFMALLLLTTTISIIIFSCESKASKAAKEEAIRIETERKIRAELEAEKAAEERTRKQKQEEVDRLYNKFVGTYSFYESKYDERYGVLSDGRVIHNVGYGKEYCGSITIISDNAFMIRPTKSYTYSVGPIDAYAQRNGREVNVHRGSSYIEYLVFEITTNRAYESASGYRNRDIAEAPYVKFTHSSSVF